MAKPNDRADRMRELAKAAATTRETPKALPAAADTDTGGVGDKGGKYAGRTMVNTGLHIPADLLDRLSIVAMKRRRLRGKGRASVSEEIVALVEKYIADLEGEVS